MATDTTALTALQMRWLLVGLTLVVAPHFLHQPIWVSLSFALLMGWRLMNILQGWPLPDRKKRRLLAIKHGLALAVFILVFATYGNTIGRDAGLALLVVLLGLKVVEIKTRRDYYVSCFLGYFLVITNFFYSQSIPTAILMLLVVTIMTASLISLNDTPQALSTRGRLRLAGTMLLQSIPVMLFCFLLFPRISGPLWGLPQDAYGHSSGISDSMSPGQISQLSLSDAIAFRVKFDGPPPHQRELYWRGPVLWNTDGNTWTQDQRKNIPAADFSVSGTNHSYTVTMEPHNQHWLFALEMPAAPPVGTYMSFDYQLLSKETIQQRQRFSLSSFTQFRLQSITLEERIKALKLPESKHPKAKHLAQQWRQQNNDPDYIIKQALKLFNTQSFFYTLRPPVIPGDFIDGFLFGSKRGFCEHYSAAFTVLMRAAGIPARVVTGYQGGEINPVDNYLLVRQRDAHAWAEVWTKSAGWQRVDPTGAVSPSRIEQGIETITPTSMLAPLFIADNPEFYKFWQNLRHNWDALNNTWNQWVLGYGPQRQKELLEKLGMTSPDWNSMTLWLTITVTSVLLFISGLMFLRRIQSDPLRKIYDKFCRRLAQHGIHRHIAEGPLDFGLRAQQGFPDQSREINYITQLYIDLRYGVTSKSLQELRLAIHQFRPHANKSP